MIPLRLALESALGDREVFVRFQSYGVMPLVSHHGYRHPGPLSSCTSRAGAVVSSSTRCPAPVTYDQGTSRPGASHGLPPRTRA